MSITPILDLSHLCSTPCKLTVPEIDMQLDWHRRHGNAEEIPMKRLLKVKADKLKALINAAVSYSCKETSTDVAETPNVEYDSEYESDPDLY